MWTEEQARHANDRGAPYTVLVGSPEKPTCFLEVTQNAVAVGFLDKALRERLSYSFKDAGPGMMFLSMATYRDFVGDTDVVAEGTSYIFEEGGEVSIRRQKFAPHVSETAAAVADVSGNYEPKPSFGNYGGLTRAERQPLQMREENG